MDKNFIKDMNIQGIIKYKKPCMIIMSGPAGSGKTTIARNLSKKLKIFLLSTDYVRNYYYLKLQSKEEYSKKIQYKVKVISYKRLLKLLLHRTSFVFDKDFNLGKDIIIQEKLSKLLGYKLIKIRIDSNDDNINIERIGNRVLDYENKDEEIIGDNVCYSSAYSTNVYYDIKKRKPRKVEDINFDYIISNNGSLEEYDLKIDETIQDIKLRKLVIK